jgi:hypothetical protein
MTPAAIIRAAKADGVMLVMTSAGNIKAGGERAAVNRWLTVIRQYKPEIVAALTADPALTSRWWLVHYLDGAPVEVWTSPPATQAEILAGRPDAIAAEPIIEERAGSVADQPEPAHPMTAQSWP